MKSLLQDPSPKMMNNISQPSILNQYGNVRIPFPYRKSLPPWIVSSKSPSRSFVLLFVCWILCFWQSSAIDSSRDPATPLSLIPAIPLSRDLCHSLTTSPPNPHSTSVVLISDCVAIGSALASHLSYYWQSNVVNSTDVLDRYKALVIDRAGADLLNYDY